MKQDYKVKALKSLLLAWVSYRKGNKDEAEQILSEIASWWQSKGLERPNPTQGKIAVFLLSDLAELPSALKVSKLILDDYDREGVAVVWAREGALSQAIELAQSIETPHPKVGALQEIAEKLLAAGMNEQARELLEQAIEAVWQEDIWDLPFDLIFLTEMMVKAGMTEQAKQALEKGIGCKEIPEWALDDLRMALVRVLAQMCEFDRAIEVANAIDVNYRPVMLERIATAMEQVGMVERARQLLEQAAESLGSEWQLWKLQKEFCDALEAEEFDRAIELAESVESKQQGLLFHQVAVQLAISGQFDHALEVAEKIDSEQLRLYTLAIIAENMAVRGEVDRAIELVERVGDKVKAIALSLIVMALAETKKFDQAIEMITKIPSHQLQSSTLTVVATMTANIGMAEKAKELLQMAWQVSFRAKNFHHLWNVATTSADLGFDDLAVDYIGQIIDLVAEWVACRS